MTAPLLNTKLFTTPPRPGAVPRPRLIERLDEGLRLGHRLILISAPPGFGKTTLLSEWIQHTDQPVAWLSLDESDNDPMQFWTYFLAALQAIQADIGTAALATLRAPLPPPTAPARLSDADASISTTRPLRIKAALTGLINELAAFSRPLVLVLDDFHVITEQQIQDALVFTLDNLPPQMHLVVSSRADPPWPLARLRGRGHITELRAGDLRFTPEEVTAFLSQTMQLDLSPEDVAALEGRTEGWIAGLQMAAASIRGRQDVSAFIQAFTGSHRHVLDYLMQEVLQRQTRPVKTFLLHTSILDRLTGPLCDAVLAHGQNAQPAASSGLQSTDGRSQEILEYLERNNLFVVPLDGQRRWYRYHRLFADLLRNRLQHMQPDMVPILHLRASIWYEQWALSLGQSNLMSPAIDHALAAQDVERAANLIMQIAETTLGQTRVATFLNWVDRLPQEVVRARPSLSFYHAFALLLNGHPLDAVRARLQHVSEDEGLMGSRKATLEALIAISQVDLPRAIQLSEQALKRLPEDELYWRSLALWILHLSRSAGSDLKISSQAFDQVVSMLQEKGNLPIGVVALCYQADLLMRQGQLNQAKALYEQALALSTDQQGNTLPVAGEALLGLGELYREWNDLETATRYLEEGVRLTKQWRSIEMLPGYLSLARLRQARGDVSGAQEAIQQARQLAKKFDAAEWDDWLVALEQARLWLVQGNTGAAIRWIEEQGLDEDTDLTRPSDKVDLVRQHLRKYKQVLLARVLLAQRRPKEALVLLELLQEQMEQQGRVGMVIEALVLKALAYSQPPALASETRADADQPGKRQARAHIDQAMTALERALFLAEPEGYIRIFIDEGAPLGELLRHLIAQGVAVDYATRLVAALEGEWGGKQQQAGPPAAALVEPLSQRELEVLQLIAAGMSNREIAQRLVVAVSTVKTHVHHIYGKLGVTKRTQAVGRARELKIL
ncbi:MAG: AAA family ATPase [Anaerolineales bacterium]|nr:MAG: AAA family ATPase [Anaerolineales bacterium]